MTCGVSPVVRCCPNAGTTPAGGSDRDTNCAERIKVAVDAARKELGERYSKIAIEAWGVKVRFDSGGGFWSTIGTLLAVLLVLGALAFLATLLSNRAAEGSPLKEAARLVAWMACAFIGVLLIGVLLTWNEVSKVHETIQTEAKRTAERESGKGADAAVLSEILSSRLASTQAELDRTRAELAARAQFTTTTRQDSLDWIILLVAVAALTAVAFEIGRRGGLPYVSSAPKSVAPTTLPSDSPLHGAATMSASSAPDEHGKPASPDGPIPLPGSNLLEQRGKLWIAELNEAVTRIETLLSLVHHTPGYEWLSKVRDAAFLISHRAQEILIYADRYTGRRT